MNISTDIGRRHDEIVVSGVAAQSQGRFGLALDLFQESLELAEQLGERRKMHAARLNISSCLLSLGDWIAARSGLAAIILESEDPRFISGAALRLAEALMKEGRLEKSAHYLRMGVEKAREAGDGSRLVFALMMQGHVALQDGRHAEAVGHYAEAIAVHEHLEGSGTHDLAVLLDKLGYAQVLAGEIGKGLWTLRRSLRLAERNGNEWARAEAHGDLAFGLLLGDRNDSAARHALKALGMAGTGGYSSIRKSAIFVLMEAALRNGKGNDFERWFHELQLMMPEVKLSRDFFKIFDITDVINLKEF